MITNIRLDLDDDQRRQIASLLAGKPVRRLAKRQEVVRFVEETLQMELSARHWELQAEAKTLVDALEKHEPVTQGNLDFCSDDCCTRNDLLQRRVNILQNRLDTL